MNGVDADAVQRVTAARNVEELRDDQGAAQTLGLHDRCTVDRRCHGRVALLIQKDGRTGNGLYFAQVGGHDLRLAESFLACASADDDAREHALPIQFGGLVQSCAQAVRRRAVRHDLGAEYDACIALLDVIEQAGQYDSQQACHDDQEDACRDDDESFH